MMGEALSTRFAWERQTEDLGFVEFNPVGLATQSAFAVGFSVFEVEDFGLHQSSVASRVEISALRPNNRL